MVMFNPAATSLPVAFKKHLSVITCYHPAGTRIRRLSPVAVMPPVMAVDRIPVSFNPHVFRLRWRWWNHVDNARWGWRTNVDSDRNGSLGSDDRSAGQQHCSNTGRRSCQTLHRVNLHDTLGNFRSMVRQAAQSPERRMNAPTRGDSAFKCETQDRKV